MSTPGRVILGLCGLAALVIFVDDRRMSDLEGREIETVEVVRKSPNHYVILTRSFDGHTTERPLGSSVIFQIANDMLAPHDEGVEPIEAAPPKPKNDQSYIRASDTAQRSH